jgi:hypothetical protein
MLSLVGLKGSIAAQAASPHLWRRGNSSPCLRIQTFAIRDSAAEREPSYQNEARAASQRSNGPAAQPRSPHAVHQPYASVTRSLFYTVKQAFSARGIVRPGPGPVSFAVLAMSALFILLQAFRRMIKMILRVLRNCQTCHGFGIERCAMCEGQGMVRWDAKWCVLMPNKPPAVCLASCS